jgi:MscS family membrane protein
MAPPALWRAYLQRVLGMLAYGAIAWLLARLVDLGGRQYVAAMLRKGKSSATSVVPLVRRSLKVLVVAGAVLASLELWGYNTTTLLTGLGIGGVAVALAAQKTIENLFGGVALITDQPVKVGDVCKFGDRVGTIEDIGLRSTRIRTPERTVVSVPNGQFSSMPLENVSNRDRILFNPKFPLHRETTTVQIRRLLDRVDGILAAHPLIAPGGKRVRFNGVGAYSHDLEVFAYVQTTNYDEYLGIQEQLQLAILDAVAGEGAGLATPPR